MSNNPVELVAQRIKELRFSCGYTEKQMANELGIDENLYRSYEESGENIPISVLYEISKKCNVDFYEVLTGNRARLDTYHVVRGGEGKECNRYPGYSYKDLAYRYTGKIMQPLLVTLDPSKEPAELVTHAGQEFNMVVEGSIAIVFEDKEIILNQGDSIYFNPTMKHGQKCAGNKKAKFLTVISE